MSNFIDFLNSIMNNVWYDTATTGLPNLYQHMNIGDYLNFSDYHTLWPYKNPNRRLLPGSTGSTSNKQETRAGLRNIIYSGYSRENMTSIRLNI